MDLSTFRNKARESYGLDPSAEDALFTNALLTRLTNEALREAAERALLYWEEFTADLTADTRAVSLDADLIRLDAQAGVRCLNGGIWRDLKRRDRRQLRMLYGPLEEVESGEPVYYFVRGGGSSASSADTVLELVPPPDASAAGALAYSGYLRPAEVSADDAEIPLDPPDLLLPLVHYRMAQVQFHKGDREVPLAFYRDAAEQAIYRLREEAEGNRRIGTRSVHYIPRD